MSYSLSAGGRRQRVSRRQGIARWMMAVLAAVSLLAGMAYGPGARAQEDFLDPAQAFVFSAAMAGPTELQVHFRIAPGYYMYRERFQFKTEPRAGLLGEPVFPRGTVKYDPTFEKDLEVYHGQVTVRLPLQPGEADAQTVTVTGQGCADAGLCYPPTDYTLRLEPAQQGYRASGQAVAASVPPPRDEKPAEGRAGATGVPDGGLGRALHLSDTGLASFMASMGWPQLMALALALGVLLTFTPCVLPMVPIVLAVVAGDARGSEASRWRGLGLAASYVLGMSLVYTALGVAAGLVGASLAAWLQTPWVLGLFAVLLALLALAMFDVFTFQAPAGMQSRLSQLAGRIPGGRWGGAFLMGMVSALIVGPCVAAPLAGVLLFISQTGDVVLGGSALFALAWGQGVLLLALGAGAGALLPRAGAWMDGIKRLFGMLLLATAWWMAQPVVPAWLGMLGWALLACGGGLMLATGGLAVRAESPGAFLWQALRKAAGLLLLLWAALLLAGLAGGGRDALRPLAPFAAVAPGEAGRQGTAGEPAFTRVRSLDELEHVLANAGKPVMLDFYADWCVSCIEMERFTFSDPAVARRMAGFALLRADVTANTDDDRALLKRFKLFGPPGIIFFDSQGREREDARVVGFQDARRFGAVLDKVAGPG